MSEKTEDKPFISRWAQRKSQARAQELSPQEDGEAPAEELAEQAEELSEEEVEAKLAEVEQLKQGDDFKPFIKATMPEVVRRAALRKLWRSNPIFGFLDGMNDYDLDYTDKATVVANLKTAYRVGKGYLPKEEPAEPEGASSAEEADEAVASPDGNSESTPTGEENAAQSSEIDRSGEQDGETSGGGDEMTQPLDSTSTAVEREKSDVRTAASENGEEDQKNQSLNRPPAALRRWERFKAG